MAKSASYTKSGSGRYHKTEVSERTFYADEPRGSKLKRKAMRGHVGCKHITKKQEYKLKHKT
jgi:hypothetical protein